MTSSPPDVEYSTSFPSNASATMKAQTGAAPFTIEMWVRVDALGADNAGVFMYGQAASSFKIGVFNPAQAPPVFYAEAHGNYVAGPAVVVGEWFHLALTYDGQVMTLIADAGAYQSVTVPLPPADVIVVGQQPATATQFSVSDIAVWSVVRTTLEIAHDMWADPSTTNPGLLFYGDFSANPPTDIFGSPISVSGTGFNRETPNVRNVGTGYLLPAASSDLNPNFAAPFTLSFWTQAVGIEPSEQAIYSNGDLAVSGSWWINYYNPGIVLSVNTGQGLEGMVQLDDLALSTWTHLAFTWDGANLTSYADGKLAMTTPMNILPAVPAGQSMLFNQMNGGLPVGPYTGYIQSLACWNVCLTPDQIAASMNADPSNDPACTAFFACSINPPADLAGLGGTGVSGQDLLQFVGTGVSFDQVGPGIDPAAAARREESARAGDGPGSRRGRSRPTRWDPVGTAVRRKFRGSVSHHVPAIESFSEAHVALMKREMRATLVLVRDPEVRKRMIAEFDGELDEVFSRARANPASVHQTFTYERVADRWLISMHGAGGSRVVAEYDATITPSCVVWWVTFIFTVISGVLTLSGIEILPEDLQALIDDYVRDAAFTAQLIVALAPGMTATALLAVIALLYEFGLLGKVFWLAFSALSWWAAGKAVLKLVEYVAPPPILTRQQAMLVKNTVVLVAQLAVQLNGYSGACPPQQEDRRPGNAPRLQESAVAG